MKPGLDGYLVNRDQYRALVERETVCKRLLYPYATPSDLLSASGKVATYFAEFTDQVLPPAPASSEGQQEGSANTLLDRLVSKTASPLKSRPVQIDRDSRWRLRGNKSELIRGIGRLRGRYIACYRVSKHILFVFVSSETRPCDKVQAFLFDDDYSFGILQSGAYGSWWRAKRELLKSDFRYSMQSAFNSFPWPQSPKASQVDAVAEAGRAIRRLRRKAILNAEGGLLAVYRQLEHGGSHPLKDAHVSLDAAVLDAYGFSARNGLVDEIVQLNQEIAHREGRGDFVKAPGVPKDYPNLTNLVTEDCIKPD